MSSSDSAVPTSAGVLPVGTRLNETYEIDAFIKAGGMGEVYRGHEIQTGEAVAIKLIREQMASEGNISEIFRREARVLRRIHHEAVVRYFGFALEPHLQRHYLAMEFVEGTQLSELLRAGPLPVASALALLRRLAAGLQAAHDQNVIHRDVSPDNIIIPESGIAHARIIDFGIAHSLRVEDATVIGGFAGKYKYASPEQLFGGQVSSASDIYSLGLVLAQCLLGRPLDMGGAQFNDVLDKRNSVPDLSEIDPAMQPLIARMLQPDPAARPNSMAEVGAWSATSAHESTIYIPPKGLREAPPAKAFDAVAARRVEAAPAPDRRKTTVYGLAAFGTSLLVVIALGAWYALAPHPSNPAIAKKDAPEPAALASATEASIPAENATRIRDFMRAFDGGECFYATAAGVTSRSAEITGIGQSNEAFDAMADAFKRKIGFAPEITVDRIQAPQCSALSFLRRFGGADDAPRFDVARTLRSGDRLEGAIETDASHVLFFIVEDNGLVTDLSSWIGRDGDRRDFTVELRSPRPLAAPSPILLIAIAATKPLPSVQAGKTPAREFFAKLNENLSSAWPRPTATVSYLTLIGDH